MNSAQPGPYSPSLADLRRLDGKIVLVKSSRDRRNPPTARRGTIEVREKSGGHPEVALAIEFPQMFTTRAHHDTIVLDAEGVRQLMASESNGTFEFTIDDELA